MRARLFKGCRPEVAAAFDGTILAVGEGARAAAGRDAEVVELEGRALPGLHDAHIHLEGLADGRLSLELSGAHTRQEFLASLRRACERLPEGAWLVGRGWYNDAWGDDPSWPRADEIERAVGGRPAFLRRKDGHSALVSRAAAGQLGSAAGTLKEGEAARAGEKVPKPGDAAFDRAMEQVLRGLARKGLTSLHSMDGPRAFRSWQRLAARGRLPLRVTWNLPMADLEHAERLGLRSGWGDDHLRIWGVKAFLDGSLGSRTAEMLDGSGQSVLPQDELVELVHRCARAELNVCLHAIGDGAVRRALDALAPKKGAWAMWRPRIEHAQCVHPKDQARMGKLGVIASMQPIHAVADRELADENWSTVARNAYAWRALERAGVRLAFGSDAPVETADPLAGIEAATSWRRAARWYPDLALTRASALRAYTSGAAFAAGMEGEVGSLRPGRLCDLTVVEEGRVVATIAGGRVTWRRKRS